MNTQLRNKLANRQLKAQMLDVELADKIFGASLVDGLKPYNSMIDIEFTANDVPSTGKAIHKMYNNAIARLETFKVYNAFNDAENLFFTPETNLLYRTLHDIDHAINYSNGKGTTSRDSELYLNCLMAKRAYTYAIDNGYTQAQAIMTFLCVYHDNVGQVNYYFVNNDFCENQKDLTNKLLSECQGMKYLSNGLVTSAKQFMYGLMNTCNVK